MTETTEIFVPEIIRGLHETDTVRMSAIGAHKIATSTRKNYFSQWKKFESWAADREVSALPAAPEHVAAYLAERSDRDGLKPSTLRMISAAVPSFSILRPSWTTPATARIVRTDTQRLDPHKGRRPEAGQRPYGDRVQRNHFRRSAFHAAAGVGTWRARQQQISRGEIDMAIIGLMRDGSVAGVRGGGELVWSDVRQVRDGTGRLLIRHSKTDQDRQGRGGVHFGPDDGEP